MMINRIHVFDILYKTTATINFLRKRYAHVVCVSVCLSVCVRVMSQELQCEVRCVSVEDE